MTHYRSTARLHPAVYGSHVRSLRSFRPSSAWPSEFGSESRGLPLQSTQFYSTHSIQRQYWPRRTRARVGCPRLLDLGTLYSPMPRTHPHGKIREWSQKAELLFPDREDQKTYSVRCLFRQFPMRLMISLNLSSPIPALSSSGIG